MFKESNTRSILKTISWRTLATLTTAILVFIFTGKWQIALAIGGIEVVIKIVLYFLHERAWNNVEYGKKTRKPAVLWFIGLSGAGKSTISEAVYERMKKKGYKVEHLDGDVVRNIFPRTGFTKEERDRHIRRVGFLASRLEKNGVFVLASFISPYKESREFVRGLCDNFKEIYISTPLEICEERDPKGLYAKARAGDIKNFTGIDDPFEAPEAPELSIDTSHVSVEEAVNKVMRLIS